MEHMYTSASVIVRVSSTHPASQNDNLGLDITGDFHISIYQKKYNHPDEAKETHGIKHNN